MSEFINNNTRIESIFQFCLRLIKGEKGTELIKEYQGGINSVTPSDIVMVVHRLVEVNLPMSDLKMGINKALNVFYKTIVSKPKIQLSQNHFSGIMMRENRELEKRLAEIKPLAKKINLLKDKNEIVQTLSALKLKFEELVVIEKHYSRKENVFFPYFENQYPEYKCLGVMWSIHDDIRKVRKDLVEALGESSYNLKKINKLMGDLFFFMNTIIFREDYLLFPVAVNAVSEDLWEEMNQQSIEIGFSFIDAPVFTERKKITKKGFKFEGEQLDAILLKDTLLNFDTGLMTLQQAMMLLNNLPVDITMIDENARVRFFSNPKERFFTRSKAIIGRTVQNCHPPESVHVVDDLIKAFKSGEKDSEPFWIQMKSRFILI